MRLRSRRDQRGAAAVEAALVTPLIMLLVFGMIEMAFLMRDYVSVTSSVRAGARMASAGPNLGPAVNDGAGPPVSNTQNVPRFAQLTAETMRTTGSALDTQQIEQIWVYQANAAGQPLSANCTLNCVRFTWAPRRDQFIHDASTSWADAARKPCTTQRTRVGVRMFADHDWLTGMFDPIEITDDSVMSFEPLTREDC